MLRSTRCGIELEIFPTDDDDDERNGCDGDSGDGDYSVVGEAVENGKSRTSNCVFNILRILSSIEVEGISQIGFEVVL